MPLIDWSTAYFCLIFQHYSGTLKPCAYCNIKSYAHIPFPVAVRSPN